MLRPSFTNVPHQHSVAGPWAAGLRAFNRERPRCTLSEIAAQIGLSRAVARRSLLTCIGLCGRARQAVFSDTARARARL